MDRVQWWPLPKSRTSSPSWSLGKRKLHTILLLTNTSVKDRSSQLAGTDLKDSLITTLKLPDASRSSGGLAKTQISGVQLQTLRLSRFRVPGNWIFSEVPRWCSCSWSNPFPGPREIVWAARLVYKVPLSRTFCDDQHVLCSPAYVTTGSCWALKCDYRHLTPNF